MDEKLANLMNTTSLATAYTTTTGNLTIPIDYSGYFFTDLSISHETETKTKTTVEVEEEMSEDDLREVFTPIKIYYNNPVTVVFWSDNTKTVVRLHKGEEYNEYTAFTAALAKKIFGNNTRVNKIVASGIKPKKKK